MCTACYLLLIGLSVVYYGVHHWPDKAIDNSVQVIDAEWEEINPKENKIDIYV